MAAEQVLRGNSVGAFDPAVMPWDVYEELLRYQLQLRGITDDKAKKLVVITEIGPKAYMELVNALEGKQLKDVESADEILKLLKKRYSPKKLLIAERHRMLLLNQEAGQGLAEFYSRIQEAANKCAFESSSVREMMVVQVFVKGIRSESTRVAVLQKENLSPTQALETAQILDMAESEAHQMGGPEGHEIHRVMKRGDAKCHECGMRGHFKAECPEIECYNCGESGHYARKCKAKRRRNSSDFTAHRVSARRSASNTSKESGMGLLRVEARRQRRSSYLKSCPKPVSVRVTMAGQGVNLELDTGSPVTIVSEETWKRLGKPRLSNPTAELSGIASRVPLIGEVNLPVTCNGKTAPVKVFVTRVKYNLMGRRAIKGFGIDLNKMFYESAKQGAYEVNRSEEPSGQYFSSRKSSGDFSYPRGGSLHTAGERLKSCAKGNERGFSTTTVVNGSARQSPSSRKRVDQSYGKEAQRTSRNLKSNDSAPEASKKRRVKRMIERAEEQIQMQPSSRNKNRRLR